MWTYQQSTGNMHAEDGSLVATGYSGRGEGLNNPDAQDRRDEGPIPRNVYTIGPAGTDPGKGPVAMHLFPQYISLMYGRAGFMIHGDNEAMNHSASEGCIILPREARERIAASGDDELVVVR